MMQIVFWDVQHGSAAYVETPNGKKFAIDLGTGSIENSKTDFSPLQHLKNHWNVSQIDGVLITHPHRDHLDDIFNFEALSPKVLRRPNHLSGDDVRGGNQEKDSKVIEKYLQISAGYNQSTTDSQGQDTSPFLSQNNGGVSWQSFTSRDCAKTNLNNHSIVSVLSYANSTILFPGDNESASWKELLTMPSFISAIKPTDILVAPHHGRESGFYAELFDHISPKLTIISDGPAGSTTVTGKYQAKSTGWTVHNRTTKKDELRYCLTTRKDKVIVVKFGYNVNNRAFIHVDMG